MSPQAENVKKTAEEFAADLAKQVDLPSDERVLTVLKIAFISGQLNICSVLSINDGGIHPSKIGAAIKEYGTTELGLGVGRIGDR